MRNVQPDRTIIKQFATEVVLSTNCHLLASSIVLLSVFIHQLFIASSFFSFFHRFLLLYFQSSFINRRKERMISDCHCQQIKTTQEVKTSFRKSKHARSENKKGFYLDKSKPKSENSYGFLLTSQNTQEEFLFGRVKTKRT